MFTYTAASGCIVPPTDAFAQAICLGKQGFNVLALPPFTPTMPKAARDGSVLPHCG